MRLYFRGHVGDKAGINLCRQCATKHGIRFIVDAVLDGGDIEAMFKDIMMTLAQERRMAQK